MKKEHYYLIIERFQLGDYSINNNSFLRGDEKSSIEDLIIRADDIGLFDIVNSVLDHSVFINLPNEHVAQNVMQYIKDTEILFI